MKFHLNLNYSLEADNVADASEVVAQLTNKRNFSCGTLEVTGFNLNVQQDYPSLINPPATPAAEGADPEADGDSIDDDIPF